MEQIFSVGWCVLVLLRVSWVFLPQRGYIHPDEFFQTAEVISGDILGLETERPWEYNESFPLRSVVLPTVTCGPGYWLLSNLRAADIFSGPLTPPTYWILVAPRVIVVAISILMDVLLGKIAKNLGIGQKSSILCYATSYVTFVHLTRTFINTFETFLFVLLLYFCSKSSPWTNAGKKQNSWDTCIVSLVVVAGVFNRPTFLTFAGCPLTYWFFKWHKKSIFRKSYEIIHFGIIFTTIFILLDTSYYRKVNMFDIVKEVINSKNIWEELPSILCVTPYNFLLYNLNPLHLAEHGVHSRFTHLIINLPMLFGPCAVLFYGIAAIAICNKNRQQTVRDFLLLSIFVPSVVLSTFVHQEARFLLPVIIPMSLLCGTTIFGKRFSWRLLRILWLAFNIFGAFVFGVLHQGGVTESITFLQRHLNQKIASDALFTEHHVVFYHTYMPPKHLFGKPLHNSQTDLIHIHDLKGTSLTELHTKLGNLKNDKQKDTRVILVTPSMVLRGICKHKNITTRLLFSPWPHVSFEDPPDLFAVASGEISYNSDCSVDSEGLWSGMKAAFSLHVLEIT